MEDIGSIRDAGAIAVLRSGSGGLTATGDQIWSRTQPLINEVAQQGDRSGSGLPTYH